MRVVVKVVVTAEGVRSFIRPLRPADRHSFLVNTRNGGLWVSHSCMIRTERVA